MLTRYRFETRWDHKAFYLNGDKRQLRALALPINTFSREGLKLHLDFRPTRFSGVWVEGFGSGCRRIKRLREQCSATPRILPGPCNV